MNRKGLLLGFLATGGQVLLLRELVSTFHGDELFIGTALFGWLVWVALGAYLGGRTGKAWKSHLLFAAGVVLLPVVIIAVRFSPLVVTDIVGEMVPFSTAALVSILVMTPIGVISGWLFPVIVREGKASPDSIVTVYFFEGLGAFAGGVAILLLVGGLLSTLGMSLALGAIVLGGTFWTPGRRRSYMFPLVVAALLLVVIIAVFRGGETIDVFLDGLKHASYEVEASFDTHYGHQTALARDSSITLLTDNAVEAVFPDWERAENLLIPPLVYRPEARSVLLIGRSEFGISSLVGSMSELSLTAVDPRGRLTPVLDRLLPDAGTATRIEDDPVAFFSGAAGRPFYDIVIMAPGGFDSYRNSRLLTEEFLGAARRVMKPEGLLCLATDYDTDRYITDDEKAVLSIIYNVLRRSFNHVMLWPGNSTLFFASRTPILNLPYDSIAARLASLPFSPRYVNDYYLVDRLNPFKMERLRAAMGHGSIINSIERPILTHFHAWYRSKASFIDRSLMSVVLKAPLWLLVCPILILGFFAWTLTSRARGKRFGLFLYFVAGAVSLSLELISFYLYQSYAGSLYSELAFLIGGFMFGLAVGTYLTSRTTKPGIERLALSMLLAATILFLVTFRHVPPGFAVLYHWLFLVTMALATGSLFVAATRRYYPDRHVENPGLGYGCELAGSAVGALLVTTFLLPLIGLHWLLLSLAILIIITIIGGFTISR